MRSTLNRAAVSAALLVLVACGGGDSSTPILSSGTTPVSSNTPIFDPSTGNIPLPNVLATATTTSVVFNTTTPPAGALAVNPGVPLTPDKGLAFVNVREVGGTNAVSGVNAPIYIRFAAPVDPATVTAANIKVFQLTPDAAGTEDAPLGFTDLSALFTFKYTAGGTDLHLFPKLPLLPASRYLYVVTNRVKDVATGLPVNASVYFDALKSTVPLTGAFAALEPVRANVLVNPLLPQSATNPIKFSGYAKVMNDLIAASATTTIASRGDLTLLGRYITTGAGFMRSDLASAASTAPVETLLWAWANNGGTFAATNTESRVWSNAASTTIQASTPTTVSTYFTNTATAWGITPVPASASVGAVITGTFQSGDLNMDPAVVAGIASKPLSGDLTTGAPVNLYNPGNAVAPGTGVLQVSRNATGVARGFYHTTRNVPFLLMVPATGTGPFPVVIFQHGIGGFKEQTILLAEAACSAGYAIIAIDQPLQGELANGRPSSEWVSNFISLPSILNTRTNMQQAAFNLWRMERMLKQPTVDPTSLQAQMSVAGKALAPAGPTHFIGRSLGSIVGTYFMAGNSIQTGGSNIKATLSVPGARLVYLLQESPSFSGMVNDGLAAAGLPTGSPNYHNFFVLAQSLVDPTDPATVTTPLSAVAPSRLSGRVVLQEAIGDTVITNFYTQYLANALGGRGLVGADIAPAYTQIRLASSTTPTVPFLYGSPTAFKASVAPAVNATTGPTEGHFQFGSPTAISLHAVLHTPEGTKQVKIWLQNGHVADPFDTTNWPITLPASPDSMTTGETPLSIYHPLP
ncbi:MAG: hypothetical protein Q8K67_08475 [Geothrix sp.]|nr:hypothetical protein [Geothrix sp.]